MGLLSKIFGSKPDLGQLLSDGAVVIDVRTPAEFKQGHAKKAVNIPLNQIESKLKKITGMGKPVITCCASGARSGSAKSILTANGVDAHNGGPWQNVAKAIRDAQ